MEKYSTEELITELKQRSFYWAKFKREKKAEGEVPDQSEFGLIEELENVPDIEIAERIKGAVSVYGPDNRIEIHALPDQSKAKNNAAGVCCVVLHENLPDAGNGMHRMPLNSLSQRPVNGAGCRDLCPGEEIKFKDQNAAAMCSGFLIGPDLVATAGHCFYDKVTGRLREASAFKFVFDYELQPDDPENRPWEFGNAQVYHGIEIVEIKYHLGMKGLDYAVVRLDRQVENPTLLQLAQSPVVDGQTLYMIGHPQGLPKKFANEAKVEVNDTAMPYFISNLDAFAGNSGSPIFRINPDPGTNDEVVGILIGGSPDYAPVGSGESSTPCCFPTQCSNVDGTTTCSGERGQRIGPLKPYTIIDSQ